MSNTLHAFVLKNAEIFYLTFSPIFLCYSNLDQVLIMSLIGNPVKFGDGPAAVIGDESCELPLTIGLGRRSR